MLIRNIGNKRFGYSTLRRVNTMAGLKDMLEYRVRLLHMVCTRYMQAHGRAHIYIISSGRQYEVYRILRHNI